MDGEREDEKTGEVVEIDMICNRSTPCANDGGDDDENNSSEIPLEQLLE